MEVIITEYPTKDEYVWRKMNVKQIFVINPSNLHLLPLHFKMVLMKNCVKTFKSAKKSNLEVSTLGDAILKKRVFKVPQSEIS